VPALIPGSGHQTSFLIGKLILAFSRPCHPRARAHARALLREWVPGIVRGTRSALTYAAIVNLDKAQIQFDITFNYHNTNLLIRGWRKPGKTR